ncbi:MAG: hypothetical protein ONB42_05580 [candidate division KSB1 bacterium]|nr:hypothetical protein [candidate division KSB1 bacterium]
MLKKIPWPAAGQAYRMTANGDVMSNLTLLNWQTSQPEDGQTG